MPKSTEVAYRSEPTPQFSEYYAKTFENSKNISGNEYLYSPENHFKGSEIHSPGGNYEYNDYPEFKGTSSVKYEYYDYKPSSSTFKFFSLFISFFLLSLFNLALKRKNSNGMGIKATVMLSTTPLQTLKKKGFQQGSMKNMTIIRKDRRSMKETSNITINISRSTIRNQSLV